MSEHQVQRSATDFDAVLVVSFGGPEKREDVLPFLENVLRGRNVPRERMLEVAEHYYHFDGVSPINEQCRELIEALKSEFDSSGVTLPIYWGNRNWNPFLTDTIEQMKADGVRNALALVLSSYSSYSGCRQYRENVYAACDQIDGDAPKFGKIRVWYNHPLWVQANADRVSAALDEFEAEARESAHLAFTAHSIPASMAQTSAYEQQLRESCRLVAEAVGVPESRWELVFQSRSGRPQDPWLEPDICDHLRSLREKEVAYVVISPIGFVSDHMEVLYDLDDEARGVADEIGLTMVRAKTVGTHPDFVKMLRELVQERLDRDQPQRACGQFGPNHDVCPVDCCAPPPRRRPVPAGGN
ncbi:ferrochelatase [Stratiformator vulcanicus]|uniref:Ferrochelatase n=1 Tax=Stratiformator vulcanicus TaxID=2527980 RepID=A0A517R2S5_9PLAN|nr:ferrochelatase [Stratiformator vulcanicus]QDT38186.1 Ferrochelatase [Stratiformator vulcanicus]